MSVQYVYTIIHVSDTEGTCTCTCTAVHVHRTKVRRYLRTFFKYFRTYELQRCTFVRTKVLSKVRKYESTFESTFVDVFNELEARLSAVHEHYLLPPLEKVVRVVHNNNMP